MVIPEPDLKSEAMEKDRQDGLGADQPPRHDGGHAAAAPYLPRPSWARSDVMQLKGLLVSEQQSKAGVERQLRGEIHDLHSKVATLEEIR